MRQTTTIAPARSTRRPCPSAERAARTIYLNRTGYNGLYRVNRAGKFNVPMGRYTNPPLCDAANLRACSKALRARRSPRRGLRRGRVPRQGRATSSTSIPPYVPVSDTADFTSYVPGGFGADQQRRLADGLRGARAPRRQRDALELGHPRRARALPRASASTGARRAAHQLARLEARQGRRGRRHQLPG